MGNSNVISADIIITNLEYFDIYEQFIFISKLSQLNKQLYQCIQHNSIELWIKLSRSLCPCELCLKDAESLLFSSIRSNVPKKYIDHERILRKDQNYHHIDYSKLWDVYYNEKNLLFWKSMCRTFISHRRIRRQRQTRFSSRIISHENYHSFHLPPRGVHPEDILCKHISGSYRSHSNSDNSNNSGNGNSSNNSDNSTNDSIAAYMGIKSASKLSSSNSPSNRLTLQTSTPLISTQPPTPMSTTTGVSESKDDTSNLLHNPSSLYYGLFGEDDDSDELSLSTNASKRTVRPFPDLPNIRRFSFDGHGHGYSVLHDNSNTNSCCNSPSIMKDRMIGVDKNRKERAEQITNDLNLFLWNEGILFNLWSIHPNLSNTVAAGTTNSSHNNNLHTYRLHSHELTKSSSLLAYSIRFRIVNTFLPDQSHSIYHIYKPSYNYCQKTQNIVISKPNSPTNANKSILKGLFSGSWCGNNQMDPWKDEEAVRMVQDLLASVGLDYSVTIPDDESYQLLWFEGRHPNRFLYEDCDDRFIVVMNTIHHIDTSYVTNDYTLNDIMPTFESSSLSLTSTRISGIHVTKDLHKRIIEVIENCLRPENISNYVHSSYTRNNTGIEDTNNVNDSADDSGVMFENNLAVENRSASLSLGSVKVTI